MRARIIALVLILAAAGGGYYYYRERHAAVVSRPYLLLYGNVDIRQADLGFDTAGRVRKMLVEEGQHVEKGELLATLDASRYAAQLAAASDAVATARAVLARLRAGSRPQEIDKARADVLTYEAALVKARATLSRVERLTARSYASRQDLDNARAGVQAATGQLEAARAVLALAVAGPRTEDIDEARAKLDAAKAEMAYARVILRDTRLYAPADGFILTRVVEPGSVVAANSPVYTLALSSPMWVRSYLPETELGKVYPGMAARITTDSYPGRVYHGWVGFISPQAEFTPKNVETAEARTALVYRVRVYVRNPDHTLRQGMPVTVRLMLGSGAKGQAPGTTRP